MALSSSVGESSALTLLGLHMTLATAGGGASSSELVISPSSSMGGVDTLLSLLGILYPAGTLCVLITALLFTVGLVLAFGPRLVGTQLPNVGGLFHPIWVQNAG